MGPLGLPVMGPPGVSCWGFTPRWSWQRAVFGISGRSPNSVAELVATWIVAYCQHCRPNRPASGSCRGPASVPSWKGPHERRRSMSGLNRFSLSEACSLAAIPAFRKSCTTSQSPRRSSQVVTVRCRPRASEEQPASTETRIETTGSKSPETPLSQTLREGRFPLSWRRW